LEEREECGMEEGRGQEEGKGERRGTGGGEGLRYPWGHRERGNTEMAREATAEGRGRCD